ncbi:hypothetical protein VHEMI00915 [[Torrubiella] hemipterigena]|uniref:Hydrophobin n=1 Tax=[Torrubiella] hemipterigena TaxID=1531966 RepID=A0A0A1T5Y2_9HYPO|nr:hypothetical protein VHEMI00915 [[Torrubiella] hemipterigena]
MQFFTIVAAFAATAAASAIPNTVPKGESAPNTLEARQMPPMACLPGLMGTPNCCATVVLGLVGLNCDVPSKPVTDGKSLVNYCASVGQQAQCCGPSLAGQALLCSKPIGVF